MDTKLKKNKPLNKIGIGLFITLALLISILLVQQNTTTTSINTTKTEQAADGLNYVGETAAEQAKKKNYKELLTCSQKNDTQCLIQAATQVALSYGVSESLDALQQVLQENKKIQEGCHVLAHEIGKNYYKNFQEKAIVKGHEWCSWGYYHGLMQAQSDIKVTDLAHYAENLCNKVARQPAIECMHGVGHAAYTKLGNIEESLTVCDSLKDIYAFTCADGVIMEEIFLSENGTLTSNFTPENCLKYTNSNVIGGCAQGLTRDMIQKNKTLQESCGLFNNIAKESCSRGYGYTLAGLNFSEEKKIPDTILHSCQEEKECAEGYGWIAYMHYIDLKTAQEKCEQIFIEKNYQACYNSAAKASKNEILQ